MRYGIVGSRSRDCRAEVEAFVTSLSSDSVVISGGCRGVDTWAVEAARSRGLQVIEFMPSLPPSGSPRHEFTKAFFARNKQIAEASDVIIAFVSSERKGGTENTIKHARKAGRQVIIK